jgi:hypothetical protein
MKDEIMKILDNLKYEFDKLLEEKRDFIEWLKDYSQDLKLMSVIFSNEEKLANKIEGQMEIIVDILNYFNSKE